MSFVRNAASVLAVSSIGIPAGFVTSVVLARWLSVEDRGVYGLVMTLASIICLASQFGLPSAAIYRILRLAIDPGRVLAAGVTLNLAVISVIALIGILYGQRLSERFLAGAGGPVLVACLAIAATQLLSLFLRAVARGIDRFDLNNAYDLTETVGTLAALAVVLVGLGGSLAQALGATLGVQLFALVVVGGAIAARTGIRTDFGRDDFVGSLGFGLKNYAQNLSRHLHERLGVLLIGFFMDDAAQAAFFVVALGLVRIVSVVPTAVATALFPQLAGLGPAEGGRFTAQVARHAMVWALTLGVGFFVSTPFLIPLIYGAPYAEAVTPLLLLLPGVVSVTVSQILSRYFVAYDIQIHVIVARVVSTLVNFGLNVWLIPRHGIVGAATASLVSNGLEAAWVTTAFLRVSGRGLGETLLFRRADVASYTSRLRRLRDRIATR